MTTKKLSGWLQFFCMAVARKTTFVSASQLRSLAQQLGEWSERLSAAADVADQQPQHGLAVYNWASVSKGLQLLRSFVDKSDESRMMAELGQPLDVGQPRPRSVAEDQTDYENRGPK